jgi:putative DNA primase/helicase
LHLVLMDNYASVVHQMQAFGVEFRDRDLPLHIPTLKRKTCGVKGKWWYWLQLFRPDAGGEYVVGRFGTYKHGGSDQKVDVDWKPLSDAEKARQKAEHEAAAARAKQVKEQAAQVSADNAAALWDMAVREGESPYLVRKGVQPEACRFMARSVWLRRLDPRDPAIMLPPGTLVLPLVRYDATRDTALRGLQLLKPDGFKIFTEGLAKTGCALRLGRVDQSTQVIMVCEGYATGLSIRMATGRRWPVYVALDAYNLGFVLEILRALHPAQRLLVCADDDWKTKDHEGPNPGRRKARQVAKATPGCDMVWPVFAPSLRQQKDTDFNDLHAREGLQAVERQLVPVLNMIEKGVGRRGR